ncbi:DNA-binding protein [Nesterenkonia massiliensis]|uniref:DNA-binding protein n=1 Tax=Nesterenkonia massiliensis TaxID=1232429 RepID=UPI0004081766|nr:DNA-binding protein [Nesterenkonia massiliensis]
MIKQQETTATPEDRAEAAARDLADRGLSVTARAVRDAAGVRMTVAAEVARAWREATAERTEVQVPEVPEDVRGRLAAIWADAYRTAHAAVSPERDQLAATVEELRAEVDALTTAVAEVEAERDAEVERAAALETERAAAVAARDEEAARAARAEDRAAAAEGERDRLNAQVTALIDRIPSANETKGDSLDEQTDDEHRLQRPRT